MFTVAAARRPKISGHNVAWSVRRR